MYVAFDYEGAFVATVQTHPDRRTIEQGKADVCGTAFGAMFHFHRFRHLFSVVLSANY